MACHGLGDAGDLEKWGQVTLDGLGLLVRSIVVNREGRHGSFTLGVQDEPLLGWQVAVTEDTLRNGRGSSVGPFEQTGGLVVGHVWGKRVLTTQTGENELWVQTRLILVTNIREVDVKTSGDRQHVRVVSRRVEKGSNQLHHLLSKDVRGELLVVLSGSVVLVEGVVAVGSREGNCRVTSVDGRVSGTNGTGKGVVTWRKVTTLVWTSNNQVDSGVVEVSWEDVVEGEGDTRRWGTVEVPDVRVLLVVSPGWCTLGRVAETTVLGQVDGCWNGKLTTVTGSLRSWGNHNDVVTSVLQLTVGGADVGGSPTIVIGEKNGFVGGAGGVISLNRWCGEHRRGKGKSRGNSGKLHRIGSED